MDVLLNVRLNRGLFISALIAIIDHLPLPWKEAQIL
jgi:hypothetical protein